MITRNNNNNNNNNNNSAASKPPDNSAIKSNLSRSGLLLSNVKTIARTSSEKSLEKLQSLAGLKKSSDDSTINNQNNHQVV